MALEQGSDLLISIDDDTLCPADVDYVGEHAGAVLQGEAGPSRQRVQAATGGAGWLNVCSLRGFPGAQSDLSPGTPYAQRGLSSCKVLPMGPHEPLGRIGINVGLWSGDPDVDAMTRLSLRPR